VKSWVDASTSNAAFGFVGQETAGLYTYQYFNFNLWVSTNRAPTVGSLAYKTPATACSGRPSIDGTNPIVFQANAADADTENVTVSFELWDTAHATKLKTLTATLAATGTGKAVTASLPALALTDGQAFDWRVIAKDSHGFSGAYSGWCKGTITYPPPAAPASASVTAPAALACATGTGRPALNIAGQAITFAATVSDPDGKQVYAVVHIVKTGDASTVYYTAKSAAVASGGTAQITMPAADVAKTLTDGMTVSWRMQTVQAVAPALASTAWSPWCEIQIVNPPPLAAPTVSVGALYNGQAGQATLTAAGAVAFSYTTTGAVLPLTQPACGSTSGGVSTVCATSGTVNIAIPAQTGNQVTVSAVAFGAAGDRSGQTDLVVKVVVGAAAHVWVIDAADAASALGAVSDLPAVGAAAVPLAVGDPAGGWTGFGDGVYGGYALRFSGENAVSSAAPALDLSGSFGIITWLRYDGTAPGPQTAVAQNTTTGAGAWIGIDSGSHLRFCITAASGTADCATSTATIADGAWRAVAATWNSATGAMSLYVDGTVAATATHAATSLAAGKFTVGAGLASGALTGYWRGGIGDTVTWAGPLSASVISAYSECGIPADPNAYCLY